MQEADLLFVFCLESVRHAIPLAAVERVIRAVEVTPLPDAAGTVMGVISVHGAVLPVVDTRRLFGLEERAIIADDLFVIVRTGRRRLALVADSVEHVVEMPAERIATMDDIAPSSRLVAGFARLQNGIVMIHDLERCISDAELPGMKLSPEEGVHHGSTG